MNSETVNFTRKRRKRRERKPLSRDEHLERVLEISRNKSVLFLNGAFVAQSLNDLPDPELIC